MNEKKRQILEAGMKLFSEKGFHNTTIQEIATLSGVSKGAFYLHFDSKEQLTLSIFKYYYQSVMDKVRKVRGENQDPTESLARQIQVLLDTFIENKEFIVMHMRDNVSLGHEVDQFIRHIKKETFLWNRENLLAIYGEDLVPSIVDASNLLDGIINGYIKWLIVDDIEIETHRLSKFITRRLDDCIKGILKENEEPQISFEEITKHFPELNRIDESQSVHSCLQSMKEKLDQLPIEQNHRQDLHNVIDLLIFEEEKEIPQLVIFQGMLPHFKDFPEMKEDCETIVHQLNIQLL